VRLVGQDRRSWFSSNWIFGTPSLSTGFGGPIQPILSAPFHVGRKPQPVLDQLDFWNTLAKHDSLLHKSLLLAHASWSQPAQQGKFAMRVFQKCSNSRLMGQVPQILLAGDRVAAVRSTAARSLRQAAPKTTGMFEKPRVLPKTTQSSMVRAGILALVFRTEHAADRERRAQRDDWLIAGGYEPRAVSSYQRTGQRLDRGLPRSGAQGCHSSYRIAWPDFYKIGDFG
jgi:hypothetical protein